MIFLIPNVFFYLFGAVMIIAVIFVPGLWLFSRIGMYVIEFLKLVFEGLGGLFGKVFGKLYDMLRYGTILEKVIAGVIILAVGGWLIRWLRY